MCPQCLYTTALLWLKSIHSVYFPHKSETDVTLEQAPPMTGPISLAPSVANLATLLLDLASFF